MTAKDFIWFCGTCL